MLIHPLLWEVALPIGIFVELPKLAGASWVVALLFWPDFSFWILGMFLLLLMTGMARIVRLVLSFMKTQRMELEVHSPVPV